ncbi:MAG: sensor histidine kinase [Phycisphaerales bacterium JB043]
MSRFGTGLLLRLMIVLLATDVVGVVWGVMRLRLVDDAPGDGQAPDIAALLLPVVIGVVVIHVLIGVGVAWFWRRGASQVGEDLGAIAQGGERDLLRRTGVRELDGIVERTNEAFESLHAEIERQRNKFRKARAVVRSMPGAVMALDTEQRILEINRVGERLLEIREEEARGRLLQEVMRSEALNTFVQEAFATEGPAVGEFLLDVGDGDQRTVQVNSRSLRNASGELAGRVIVMQDVTRLRRLERVRRDFAANVSHELRTPVTNIKGYIETLLSLGPEEKEESERFLRTIARNADRLTQIVEGMLELARLDDPAAHETLAMSMTPIETIVELVVGQMQEALASRQMSVKVDLRGGLQACVNARLVEQALHNLVSNAVKYGREGSTVEITGEEIELEDEREFSERDRERVVELGVFSEGPGIEKKHLPRVFERFYRVDPARTTDSGGVGLGLAIVKHITRLHGGREGAESIPGRGVRFWIRLPVENRVQRAG